MFNKKLFENEGYCNIENVISQASIDKFHICLGDLCDRLIISQKIKSNSEDKFISVFKNHSYRKYIYILLQNFKIIKLITLEVDKKLKEIGVYNKLNISSPSINNGLFVSLPNEKQFNSPLHQDIYAHYSNKFIKIWAPLTKVDKINGSMEIYKKSHKLGFIEPHYSHKNDFPQIDQNLVEQFDPEILETTPGSIILFNPFCLHKSVPNKSKNTRFVLGIDIQDISSIPTSDDKNSDILKMAKISNQRKIKRKGIKGR